jgi:uncharacterized membrane protein
MNTNSFSMGEAIGFGWDTMKTNIGFFIGLLIVAFIAENIPGILGGLVENNLPVISVIFYVGGFILSLVIQLGLIKISLQFCDSIKGKIADLFSTFDLIIKYVAASLLYFLIILGGFILLIIPGIIWGVKFMMYPYFIVDQGLGPIEALKASARATDGVKWYLWLFGLLLGLINIAGVLVLGVGLFVSIPISMVAFAYVFRELAPKSKDSSDLSKGSSGSNSVMYVDLGV